MIQTPNEAVSAGAVCFRNANKAIEDMGGAYHYWVKEKLAYKVDYAKSYDALRVTGEAVKSCEIHAEVENIEQEKAMLMAEGDYKLAKATYDLHMGGMTLAQSSMRVLGAEMEMAR